MAEPIELSEKEAQEVVDSLLESGTQIKSAHKLSSTQRIALGVVFLRERVKGRSLRSIGEEYGISYNTVDRYVRDILASVTMPSVNDSRATAIAQLEGVLDVWQGKALSGDPAAVNAYVKLQDQMNKLTGAYQPIQIEQTVTEISAQERELADMIAQTERDNAARASRSEINETA